MAKYEIAPRLERTPRARSTRSRGRTWEMAARIHTPHEYGRGAPASARSPTRSTSPLATPGKLARASSPDRVADVAAMSDATSEAGSLGSMPYTPERHMPPSYDDAIMSTPRAEPPASPARADHAHYGDGASPRVLAFPRCYKPPRERTRSRRASRRPPRPPPARLTPRVHPTIPAGGAEYDSLGFPVPEWLSPRCAPRARPAPPHRPPPPTRANRPSEPVGPPGVNETLGNARRTFRGFFVHLFSRF